MLEIDKLYMGDCLSIMQDIPDKSVDCVITDLPYATTPLEWDKNIIPFEPLWAAYKRIIKPNGAIVLFCQQPFTTRLISSNMEMWKYNWIWMKENGTNFLNSHYQPFKVTEDIAVFSFAAAAPSSTNSQMEYHPQMGVGDAYKRTYCGNRNRTSVLRNLPQKKAIVNENIGTRMPTNILYFPRDKDKLHPMGKPVDLLRYLIRTYTDEGDVVLDSCIGSGTTAVAAIREKRHFIGIELDEVYYNMACKRVKEELSQPTLF